MLEPLVGLLRLKCRHTVLTAIDNSFTLVYRQISGTEDCILGADIWSCVCQVIVVFHGFCFLSGSQQRVVTRLSGREVGWGADRCGHRIFQKNRKTDVFLLLEAGT